MQNNKLHNAAGATETLVSIIIPFHNRVDLLADTIKSIVDQTHRPLEVILVDDASNGQERERAKALLIEHLDIVENITWDLVTNKGKGAPAARNFGYALSKGKFIQFLDSDDVLLPTKIQSQVSILENNVELDLTYSKAQFTDGQLNRREEYWGQALQGNYYDYFLFSWQTMCPLYTRKAIEAYGLWDEDLVINQDWEFSIRYIILGAKVDFHDEVQSLFRQHNLGNIGNKQLNLEKIIGKLESTNKIYRLLLKKERMVPELKKLFVKRWIYVLLVTSSLGAKAEFDRQMNLLKKELSGGMYRTLWIFKNSLLSKFILKRYAAGRN